MSPAKTMIDPHAPALQQGKYPMDPGKNKMSGHEPHRMGVVTVAEHLQMVVAGVAVGHDDGARFDVVQDEGDDLRPGVGRQDLEPDPPGGGVQGNLAEPCR